MAKTNFEQAHKVIDRALKTISQSMADEKVKVNSEFVANAGMTPKIIRTSSGHCCDWCERIAGTYEYPFVPQDVYRRHDNCDCRVDYVVGKKRTAIHSGTEGKRTYVQDEHGSYKKTEERKKIAIGEKKRQLSTVKSDVIIPSKDRNNKSWTLSARKTTTSEGVREVLGEIDISKAREAVDYFSDEIRHLAQEHAIVIEKSGKVVHFIGNPESVIMSDVDFDGAYITHNHPISNGIVSFGEDDFYFYRENQNIKLFVCCNEEYTYYLERVKDFSEVTYNQLFIKSSDTMNVNYEMQDHIMEVFADAGFVHYTKRKAR